MIERQLKSLIDEHHACNDQFQEAWKAKDFEAMEASLELMSETRKRCQHELKKEKRQGATLILHGLRLDCLAARLALLARRVERFEDGRDLAGLDQRLYRLEQQ